MKNNDKIKNVVIAYDDSKPGTDKRWQVVFGDMETYDVKKLRLTYKRLFWEGEKRGLKFFLSYFDQYNKRSDIFTQAWELDNDNWKIVKNIKPDLVFDKAKSETKFEIDSKKYFDKKKKLFNCFFIDKLCSDKLLTYKTFPDFVPKCFVVNNRIELDKILKKIKTEMVVLKPVNGASARGIVIDFKDKLPTTIFKNTLVQEFVDTTKGIPGLIKGVSDFRVVVVNNQIDHAYMRRAKNGSLISNVSVGGKIIPVSNNKIPKSLIGIAKKINKRLVEFQPSLYTLDFAFDEKYKPWLIEMNSKPMLSHGNEAVDKKFVQKVVIAMKKKINKIK